MSLKRKTTLNVEPIQSRDAQEWRFFGDLMAWATYNRDFLQEPTPIGGNPTERQAYGYTFQDATMELFCLRSPWIEEM